MKHIRNVTVDPRSRAIAVENPELPEIMSKKSGNLIDAQSFIERHRYDQFVNKQTALRRLMGLGVTRYYCPLCVTSVYISTSIHKKFFFKHKVEDGSCPAITHDGRTPEQIKAMKYMGARESDAHKAMKSIIARSLDSDGKFENVKIERIIKSKARERNWRKPDVQAQFKGLTIAFEAQLSTTFLDVVWRRREFYRNEGMLLVWVMKRFNPEYRRLTDDRILFMNNSNMLVVDSETLEISEEKQNFHVKCVHRIPVRTGNQIEDVWETKIVSFHDLTLNTETQEAFYFDFAKAERNIIKEIGSTEFDDVPDGLKNCGRNF